MNKFDFDAIVVGSGFGGSIMTLRLAEKNYKTLLLERGREYKMHEFPRRMDEIKKSLFWDPEDKMYGFMEFREFENSDVATLTASGLGGGTLVYANVLYKMPPQFFEGWPYKISREVLDPYYEKVIDMMEASPYPIDSSEYYGDTPKTKALRDVQKKLNQENSKFVLPHLAVRFEGEFPGAQSKNKHGALQSSCIKCGECDIGCNIHAKNTLDLNYIYKAKNLPKKAEVRTHAEVLEFKEIANNGYEVIYLDHQSNKKITVTCEKLVISAGSVGSTELLLQAKKIGNLKNLSDRLGDKWCGNGDLLGVVLDADREIQNTKGPVITSAIQVTGEYPDGFKHGMFIEDAGYPIGWAWFLNSKALHPKSVFHFLQLGTKFFFDWIKKLLGFKCNDGSNIGDMFSKSFEDDSFMRKSFLLLGMGRDRSDGKITLDSQNEATIKWDIDKSKYHFDKVREEMKMIATALDGEFQDNPLTYLNKIIAVHPLGGCPMGESASDGVVGKNGEVFGHKNLYVVDGSILPTSTGPNPSLTIAAMAEYIADQLPINN